VYPMLPVSPSTFPNVYLTICLTLMSTVIYLFFLVFRSSVLSKILSDFNTMF